MHTYKTELIIIVSKETQLAQRVVSDVLNASLRQVTAALGKGQTIVLPGFGTFYTSTRAQTRVRHIRTGAELVRARRRVAAFRAGEVLKRAVRKRTRAGSVRKGDGAP